MDEIKNCQETIGLFVLRSCNLSAVKTCEKCKKPICGIHAFKPLGLKNVQDGVTTLCLTCFTEEDTRLTKDIELYSKDRYVWRRKMISQFHEKYHYMTFIAEDYGDLFMTGHLHSYDDTDDNTSFFDS